MSRDDQTRPKLRFFSLGEPERVITLTTVRNQEPGQPGKLVTSTLEQGDERFKSIFFL